MRSLFLGALFGSLLCLTLHATDSPTVLDDKFVQMRFGKSCSLVPGRPPITGDFDSDGVEDLALEARCTNPMLDAADKDFKVIDPFNTFFGYGNPKVTLSFASEDPERRAQVLLIIHGAGSEAWHSPAPKAKFLVINLPFREIAGRTLARGKKIQFAIFALEAGAEPMTSVLYWDGKRYKYRPLGSSLD
ncbi:MAG: hypothetical protein H0X25_02055 [Acidobacteriales bacterium]|nr:hypothetical protein [Terriglobales bacterium]